MRIIGVNGLWSCQEVLWRNLSGAFSALLRGVEFVLEAERGCQPWEIDRLRRFIDRLSRTYDDGAPTIIVGHSMGGIVACAVATRLERTRVRGVVTICSPHRYLGGFYPAILNASEDLDAPVVSFAGRWDILVPWGARHPRAREHFLLDIDHSSDLVREPSVSEQIARNSMSVLPKA